MDQEDLFHQSRDEIQLGGYSDETEEDEDDEIFPLKNSKNPWIGGHIDNSPESDIVAEASVHSVTRKSSGKPERYQSPTGASVESTGDEDEESWGTKKAAYYSTNAGALEDEDGENQELFLRETLRLQIKARSLLATEDFGLEDYQSVMSGELNLPTPLPTEDLHTFKQYQAQIPTSRSTNTSRDLEREHPELLALSRDWTVALEELGMLERKLAHSSVDRPLNTEQGLTHLYHQTLQCYLSLLAFYLHLSSSGMPLKYLKAHPIMTRLLTLRETTQELNLLGLADLPDSDADSEFLSAGSDPEDLSTISMASTRSSEALLDENESVTDDAAEDTVIGSDLGFGVLDEPAFIHGSQRFQSSSKHHVELSHFGDPLLMEKFDAEDKRARKKTLRFHTAKIDGIRPHQGVARHNRGGDDDLAYPSLRAVKPQRDADSSSQTTRSKRAREVHVEEAGSEEDQDDYYDLVKRQKKRAKEEKKELYEAEVSYRAEQRGDEAESEVNGGPRSLTRAILTNKGLTPHRSKAVRNPRVKKRMRYEKAKQKVSSQKQIYRGGPAGGKYGGELSGISTRTVKSAKF